MKLMYSMEEENYVLAPYSLKTALGMICNGVPKSQQKSILKIIEKDSILELNEEIKKIEEEFIKKEKITIKPANSIWLNLDYLSENKNTSFDEKYLNIVQKYYNAYSKAGTGNSITKDMNQWINEKTQGMINNISIEKDFSLAFLSTLYLKGEFKRIFDSELTRKGEFINAKGLKENVIYMETKGKYGEYYNYYNDEHLTVLGIPYLDDDVELDIILPKTPLSKQKLNKAFKGLQSKKVIAIIPKFKIDEEYNLTEMFTSLGMIENIELSEIVDNLSIKNQMIQIVQKMKMEINEHGTSIAAGVGMYTRSGEEPTIFIANRPFVFIIRDRKNHEILFLGEFMGNQEVD